MVGAQDCCALAGMPNQGAASLRPYKSLMTEPKTQFLTRRRECSNYQPGSASFAFNVGAALARSSSARVTTKGPSELGPYKERHV